MTTRLLVLAAALCLAMPCSSVALAASTSSTSPAHKTSSPHIECNLASCHVVKSGSTSSGHHKGKTPAKGDTSNSGSAHHS